MCMHSPKLGFEMFTCINICKDRIIRARVNLVGICERIFTCSWKKTLNLFDGHLLLSLFQIIKHLNISKYIDFTIYTASCVENSNRLLTWDGGSSSCSPQRPKPVFMQEKRVPNKRTLERLLRRWVL